MEETEEGALDVVRLEVFDPRSQRLYPSANTRPHISRSTQTDRQPDRQRDKETDRQTDRLTNRQRDRQTRTHTKTPAHIVSVRTKPLAEIIILGELLRLKNTQTSRNFCERITYE